MVASQTLQAFAAGLTLLLTSKAESEEVPGQGECQGGLLPSGCRTGRLQGFDWHTYLGLLCGELTRSLARQATLQALAHFDADNARACPAGFAVSMLALYGAGASELEDQIIRFKPDGSSHFLVLAWDLETGKAVLDHWSTSLPADFRLPPPWPPWSFPGPLKHLREAQDLTQLKELPSSVRCDARSLASIGCDQEAPLLEALCVNCETTNLPCTYTGDLLRLLSRAAEAAAASKLASTAQHPRRPLCGHGLLSAFLALSGRSSTDTTRTDPELYRIRKNGQERIVPKLRELASSAFRKQ